MKKHGKRDFNKFSSRAGSKQRQKDRAKRELMRAVEECGFDTSRVSLKAALDRGRRARNTDRVRGDERVVTGEFSGARGGFGFVRLEGERDVFIPEDKVKDAIDGDTVEVIFHSYVNSLGESKTEGRVLKVVKRGRDIIIGRVKIEEEWHRRYGYLRKAYLVPDDAKISFSPEISDLSGANDGDKVAAKIKRHKTNARLSVCEVIAVYGDSEDARANYDAILDECGIEREFTDEELREAERLASLPLNPEGRVLREREIIFTIDGIGAKDLDDAISLRRTGSGWLLGVHIADVSAYVPEKSPLDRLVMRRGTSVYFVDRVVPMLPPALSNGACSLNSGEDKYAISAMISLDNGGEIKDVRLEPSIIRSRLRGVYSEVNAIFDGTADATLKSKYREITPTLYKMKELYERLSEKSKSRGALELEISKAEIIIDEDGKPVGFKREERGIAERIIEHFMLTANEAVATLLSKKGIPCVYRIHENPPSDKIRELLRYASGLGLSVAGVSAEEPRTKDFFRLLSSAEEKGVLPQLSQKMLRSMSKAKYSDKRETHFGLGLEYYCHFTSPIRRLSDLATHRIIRGALLSDRGAGYYASYAKRAARAATDTELSAISAERKIENLYKVTYMADYVGEEFSAVVDSVGGFGMFVELENTCEGLVPLSSLDGVYIYDEANMCLRSRNRRFTVGDSVRVKLEEADIPSRKLRFSVVF